MSACGTEKRDLIKNLNPKITGWKNYYSTKRNEKWMQALDHARFDEGRMKISSAYSTFGFFGSE
ncbi:MAG: group II intron maturase-specific domain-containing protein [Roseburia sp.]